MKITFTLKYNLNLIILFKTVNLQNENIFILIAHHQITNCQLVPIGPLFIVFVLYFILLS